jgi:Secretion system C-terminal sorting domain/Bacterial pre-peptidase C-terminal domain/Fibronectin type III domain
LDGTNGNQWERLPGVARTLNFRMMVRDNHAGGGNTKDADVVVTVNGTAGPFAVTAPNTAVSWAGNTAQTVTWSVNATNLSPVSCANVKIAVSTNGGTSFTTLIASTPNDGTETITVPNTASTTARIKVEAVGNIFFDISNVNFTITSGSSCGNPTGLASSGTTTNAATLSWTAVSGANSYDVDYKLNSTATWTNAATATTATTVNLASLTAGSLYDWRVRANCTSASSAYTQAQFTTASVATCNAPAGLSSSAVTSSAATVSWTAVSGAVSYAVDYKTNVSSTWISAATATTATTINLSGLTASTLYDWRVRTNCTSLNSAYTQAQFTTTAVASGCATAFEPNETQATAAAIATGVANSAAISSTTDVDYFKVVTTATSNNTFALAGPSGVDYDLTIYNSAGTQIGSGAGSTATETVSLSNQAAGTYYIKVFGYSGANSATCYTITATASAVTGCASVYDNTTNGTVAGAVSIPLNTNVTGLVNVSGDIDYYKFVITTGGTATITLTTLPADYDLVLYSSNGTTQLAISQNGSTTSETISRTYTAGTYIIKVFGYSTANNATSCYTLKVTTGTATKEAGWITAAQQQFRVYPNPVENSINLNVIGLQKTGTVRVFDVMGRVVSSAAVVKNGNNRIDAASLKAGVYFIKIIDNNGKLLHQEKLIKE